MIGAICRSICATQICVEVHVLAPLLGGVKRPNGHVDRGAHSRMRGRFEVRAEVLIDGLGQLDVAVKIPGRKIVLPMRGYSRTSRDSRSRRPAERRCELDATRSRRKSTVWTYWAAWSARPPPKFTVRVSPPASGASQPSKP